MSIRKFIFCDICNPQGIRTIEFRRSPREEERTGRRISDGRAWFEGEWNMAVKAGWQATSSGQHLCPICKNGQH